MAKLRTPLSPSACKSIAKCKATSYGLDADRRINPGVNLYWLYAGLNYAFTNSGQRISFALTTGGSTDADRLNCPLGSKMQFANDLILFCMMAGGSVGIN